MGSTNFKNNEDLDMKTIVDLKKETNECVESPKSEKGKKPRLKTPSTDMEVDDLADVTVKVNVTSAATAEGQAASSSKGDFERKMCNCTPPKPIVIFVTKKEGPNKGRAFLRCPLWNTSSSCRYFEWLDGQS